MDYNLTREQEREAVSSIAPYIVEDMRKSGVLASLSLSQWILESYYGHTELALEALNFFGMKCILSGNTWPGSVWNGKRILIDTQEQDERGNSFTIPAWFRAYDSPADSIADHSAYLLGAMDGDHPRYPGLKGCTDPEAAVKIVKAGGYATDVRYVEKLLDIIKRFDLTEYDRIAMEKTVGMKQHSVLNVRGKSRSQIKKWGNEKKYIAIHYLGVTGEDDEIHDGCGAHYYVWKDGSIHWAAAHEAITYQVGTAGVYLQLHEVARNDNTIGIEMCADYINGRWVLREATQDAAAWTAAHIMAEEGIPIENVLRHGDIVSKICPEPYMRDDGYLTNWHWSEFIARVKSYYREMVSPVHKSADNPAYTFTVSEVRRGTTGLSVLLLAEILAARGYSGRYGEPLGYPRYADDNVMYAAARYMDDRKAQGVDLGGPESVGPLCWPDLLGMQPEEGLRFTLQEVREGSEGLSVLLLQEILRARGYLGKDGKRLDLDRKAGENTMYAVKTYMDRRKAEGVDLGDAKTVGPLCWADLIAL